MKYLFIHRPISFFLLCMITVYSTWYAIVLWQLNPKPGRFIGPLKLMSLDIWAVIFACVAVIALVRLMNPHERLLHVLEFISSLVFIFWAVSWYFGPTSTAQPTYTFIAVLNAFIPFITPVHRWTLRLLGTNDEHYEE